MAKSKMFLVLMFVFFSFELKSENLVKSSLEESVKTDKAIHDLHYNPQTGIKKPETVKGDNFIYKFFYIYSKLQSLKYFTIFF